jgi:homopolymeric O-antigen transport system permease protein
MIPTELMSTTEQSTTLILPDPTGPDALDVGSSLEVMETVIRPRSGWIAVDWSEMIRARELLYYFVWRDVKIRYKQTVLGVAWAVLQPLFTMIVFTLVFGRMANMESLTQGTPYQVFVFIGLIFWTFFSSSVTTAGMSLVTQQHLLTKVYFPRLFIPISCIGTLLVDLVISLAIFAILMVFYGVVPSWQTPALVPLIVLMTMAAIGLGSACAAMTVLYRDVRFVVAFAMQIMMFVSPVIFPPEYLPARFHPILALNPMFGLIDACRSAVLGTSWHPTTLAISSASSLALLAFGLYYFRKTERRFADLV